MLTANPPDSQWIPQTIPRTTSSLSFLTTKDLIALSVSQNDGTRERWRDLDEEIIAQRYAYWYRSPSERIQMDWEGEDETLAIPV
jgi:hypothetical protein